MPSCASVVAPSATPQVGEEVIGCDSAGRRGLTIGSWVGLTATVAGEGTGGVRPSISSCPSTGSAPWCSSHWDMCSDRAATIIMKNKTGTKNKMKKYFVPILTCALVNILPAADFSFSAGAGAAIGGLFTRYTLTADGAIDGEPVSVNADQSMSQFNFGGFLFADTTWAEFSIGIQGGHNNYEETMVAASPSIDDITSTSKGDGSETMLTLALLGKYPFTLSERFKVFPLLGLEYQIALMQERQPEGRNRYNRTDPIRGETDANGDTYKLSIWNSLFVVIGGGADYDLTPHIFLRGELLYGFRLQTFYEADALEKAKKGVNAPDPKLGGLTSGPTLKIAAGWRF